MLVLRDLAAADAIPDEAIRMLVRQRFAMLCEDEPYDPEVFGYFIVVQAADSLDLLNTQLGFPILTNRFDDTRFGDPDFTPCFELLEEHATCFEVVFVLSDDGYGVEVFIPKSGEVNDELLAMCRRYAVPAQESRTP